MTSIMLAGGMIFMLSYASLTVMTAVCKYCALGKNQSGAQWGALLVIVLGLLINAEAAEQAVGDVFYGALAGFGAAVRARAPRWCFLVFSSQAQRGSIISERIVRVSRARRWSTPWSTCSRRRRSPAPTRLCRQP